MVAGENIGRYYFRSFGHTWASLDDGADVPNDQEHLRTAVSPHIHNISSMVTEWMMKMSRWPEGPETPKMVEVTVFTLDYAHADDFFHVIKKIHGMIGEKELPLQYSWGRVAVGGSGMQLTLAIPRSGWADFEPPKPGIWDAFITSGYRINHRRQISHFAFRIAGLAACCADSRHGTVTDHSVVSPLSNPSSKRAGQAAPPSST